MDTSGYIFILDRTKDMVISGGANIYPREIEEVIQQHPAVREVAVVGVPDDVWGESVKAVVALRTGYVTTEPTLEVADGTLAELRALGQFHLSEAARTPMMPQDICKYQYAITELLHHGPQPSGIGSAV
jgi:acyl-CoA synthetase (AMP-forming)/AMP-acid ligase II